MQVGAFGVVHMVSQPGADTSRPECAADVDVETRLEPQVAQPPDRDYSIRGRQQEGICAGVRFEVGRSPLAIVALGEIHPAAGTFALICRALKPKRLFLRRVRESRLLIG